MPFTEHAEELLEKVREFGLEGLVGKRAGSRYEPGRRGGTWIKLVREQEFVIGRYTEPEGSRNYFGALLVGVYEGKSSFSAAGSGQASLKRAS